MAFFLTVKSVSAAQNAQRRSIRRPRRKPILYPALALSAIAVLISASAVTAAQEPAPEIKPLEGNFNKKKDQGPRAVGLLQLSSNGKAKLIPIAIRVDGKFYDAVSYKANPIPMALESGTVYEAERTGKSLGLFTVSAALHSNAINAVTPWIGTGLWLPEGTEAPKSGRKAESVPVGIEASDAPPRLAKSGAQKTASPEASPPTAQTPPATSSPESKPPSESKPSTQTNSDTAAPDAAKQADHGSASSDSNSSAGDSNRPRLRRGKPTEPLPSDEDVPGYSKPGSSKPGSSKPGSSKPVSSELGSSPSAGSKGTEASAGKSTPGVGPDAATQFVPAVSDADGPNPRSYAFEWIKGDEADRHKQLLDLAREQLRFYLTKQAKASIAANPPGPKTAPRRSAPKPPEAVFDKVEMRTFDLWANNQPIMVLTGEAHVPPPTGKNAAGPTSDSSPHYSITLVARTDIYDNVHKLYSAVTDKYHLDVTPRLELIDAVDADGDGRGELLFRETSDAGTGYVIYRATADTLWKMFDSLNPE